MVSNTAVVFRNSHVFLTVDPELAVSQIALGNESHQIIVLVLQCDLGSRIADSRLCETIESDLYFVSCVISISVAPVLLNRDIDVCLLLIERIEEVSHMCFVLCSDLVRDNVTVYLRYLKLGIGSKNASQRDLCAGNTNFCTIIGSAVVEIVENICTVYNSLFAVESTVIELCAVLCGVAPVGIPCDVGKSLKVNVDDKCLVALVLTVLVVDILNVYLMILVQFARLDVEDILALIIKGKGTLAGIRVIPCTVVAAVPVDTVSSGACGPRTLAAVIIGHILIICLQRCEIDKVIACMSEIALCSGRSAVSDDIRHRSDERSSFVICLSLIRSSIICYDIGKIRFLSGKDVDACVAAVI